VTPALIKQIIKGIDKDKDGRVSLSEFIEFSHKQDETLNALFAKYDLEGDGQLCAKEVKGVLESLGQPVSDTVVENIIGIMDKSNDGKISYDEFRTFYFMVPKETIRSTFTGWAKGSIDIGESVVIPDDKKPGAMTTLLAGGIAGAISRTATAPLDRLKVVLQAQAAGTNQSIGSAFADIYREGGAKSFFRGNGTNVIKIAPETAIKFIMFDKIKEMTCKNPKKPSTGERLISGAVAGFTSQTMIYPLEICKTRLALA